MEGRLIKEYWIARDENGELFLYEEQPVKDERTGRFKVYGKFFPISFELFPEVTYENSPRKMEINIIE